MGIRGSTGGGVGGMGGGPDSSVTTSSGDAAAASGGGAMGGEEKVESLADILARADDGPGNLKETFRLVGVVCLLLCVAGSAFLVFSFLE